LIRRLATVSAAAFTGLLCMAGMVGAAGAAGAATGASASIPQPGGRIIRAHEPGASALPTISLNWSGYAAVSAKKFNYVHSTFLQPKISCTGAPNRWTSNWVGLDGFTDATVEQDGTFAFCGGANHMVAQYVAWYEMYPAGSVAVFRVKPGDQMDASVRYSSGKFTLTIADLTSGKTATKQAACSSCERSSAEWIIERPALCNSSFTKCFLTALADFHTTVMRSDVAQLAGGKVKGVGGFVNYPIFMVNPLKTGGFISLDTVSALSGPAFAATWDRSGTTVPITLGPER